MMIILWIGIFFGLIFWSFASVLLSRWGESFSLAQALSILWWRSQCPHCKHILEPWDLIPLLSFFMQKRKCRYCHKKISRLYPILELWSAVIFWCATYFLWGEYSLIVVILTAFLGWILWLLLVYDVLWYEVHIPLLIMGAFILIFAMIIGEISWQSLWWGGVFLLFFLLMYFFAKGMVRWKYGLQEEGLWMGDVIVAPFLGTILYWTLPVNIILLDKVLFFLLFLTMSGGIGIIWYLIQNQYLAYRPTFLPKNIANQGLPFLPAMIITLVIIVIFQSEFLAFFWG